MAIPKTVQDGLISGVVGTISHAGPTRCRAAVLDSASDKNNIFGYAFTFKDGDTVQAGGAGAFAGVMIHPHAYRLDEHQPNGSYCEFLDMGEVFVSVKDSGESKIGDKVYYVAATGELTTVKEGNTLVPNCVFERHLPSAETPNLCVIRLTN